MRKQNIVLYTIIFIALVGISIAGYIFFKWNVPLGPSLELPSYTPNEEISLAQDATQPIRTSIANPVVTSTFQPGSTEAVNPFPSPIPTQQPLCGGPKRMTILAIGSDSRDTGYLYGLADSIHVVRIDFTIPNIMVIDFPRDLWVEIPGIEDHYGITHGKLNQAYLFGNPGMGYYDGPGEGPGLLARTLDLNVGLRVDHYLAIDTQTFIHIVDTVGGVDIDVEKPIDLSYGIDNPAPKYFLSVGTHHLDGEMAYKLATNRVPSTFQRMKYQKMIASALRDKLLSPGMLPKIPKLVTQFIGSVQTDLSLNEINSLICIVQAVPKENIKADSFPQEMFTADDMYDPYRNENTFVYQVDFNELRKMVTDFMNGIWPMP
jgi:LCP family protein required for cell wall assembly